MPSPHSWPTSRISWRPSATDSLRLGHSSVGALNPNLVAAYASALEPFQGAMVGSDARVHGFAPVKGVDVDDYSGVIGIFATIASDPPSGEKFVGQRGFDLKAFYDGFQKAAGLG
jgi:hypothetical protein